MIFNPASEAAYDTMFEYEASIRSFIRNTSTEWRKGGAKIDTETSKYEGSSTAGCHPVLCINNVNEKDEDVYTIHVSNEWGDTTLDKKLALSKSKDDFKKKIE